MMSGVSAHQAVQGMEALTSAMKANIVPDQEYLLQGSVLDTSLEVLNHRLKGLCDNVDAGHQTFHEKEMVFTIRGASTIPLTLRVRHSLDPSINVPWQIRYCGQPEVGNRPTVVRSCYDIACSNNIVDFLTELGCRLEFEFVSKGYIYRKGRIKVTVSKVFKQGTGESLEGIANSHLVEMSVLATSGSNQVAEDMKAFADQLEPLVRLDKYDLRR